ncbi:MAG: cytochrome b/b6 domain-containing protein [Gammaproteobacteria bacterium]|nr:cytochrome b/b6 domain-containing protein [Gammaproteobacteria bacterium]
MRLKKAVMYLLVGFIYLISAQVIWQSEVVAATGPQSSNSSLSDAGCMECHDGRKKISIENPKAEEDEDKTRALLSIQKTKYIKSVHGDMTCIECHQEITDSKASHAKNDTPKPNCINCHEVLWDNTKEQNLTKEKAHLGIIVENIEAYKASFHAKPASTKSGFKASCDDCHDTHSFDVPAEGTSKRSDWHLTVPQVCGETCHDEALEEYQNSVHGVEALEKHNPKSAVCTDCHTAHAISKTERDPFQLLVTRQCGGCHEEEFESYRATYHGQINTLGYAHTAKCFDCHDSHEIQGVNNEDSSIHPDNRLETCQECHDGKKIAKATDGFLTFGPHATSHDFENYPQMWIAAKFMHGLLIFVFSYFWAHSLLWWYREYKDRKLHKTESRIRTDELLGKETRKAVRRFGLIWRIGHLCFAISVMMLILTGTAVIYSYTAWAPVVIDILGGPQMAGLIHRIAAAIMLSIFFLHLVGVSINIYRKRKTFRWFGPDSLIPNWKDLADAIGMFKWFVGKGPRPVFERWTYWEKFDYWAVFWGMGIIGGSGMMLAFPGITAAILPGWVFNVVMLVHGEEAFLAAVFLFTVHFFNNHFRPDKLPPPDVVMFTGSQSLEEFKREHSLQYQRLVETGELEKYLVDVPSRPMTIGSKILGLVLIAIGLSLLFIVGTGFFGGYTPH